MELKKLQEENGKLKKDLLDSRTLYNQLIQECSHEKFDERRIYLLKSQLIQLERQLLLMSDAVASRSTVLLEVENSISWLADQCRSYIALEIRGPEVPIQRARLTEMVEKLESARIKLYKNIENTSKEALSKPMMFFGNFLKPSKEGEVTMFDICSGNLDHVNLKQVAKLESQLSVLYKDLVSLHESMSISSSSHPLTPLMSSTITTDRLTTQLLKAAARVDDCSKDLLCLSLLYPAAPWSVLKKPICGEVTKDRVISSLPTLPRSKAVEVQIVLEAIIKATNHNLHMKDQELRSLRDELKFHHECYNLQTSYMGSLFEAVQQGYQQFENSVEENLCKPLQDILKSYETLSTTSSEEGLRSFLCCFKDRADTLEHIVLSLSVNQNAQPSAGMEGLSEFGKQFFSSVEKKCQECKQTRDGNAKENKVLKEQQERLDFALQKLLEEKEAQKTTGDNKDQKEATNSTQNLLVRNKQEGPPVEFCLKSSENPRKRDRLSDISVSLEQLGITDSDKSDEEKVSPSNRLASSTKTRSLFGNDAAGTNSVQYSKNRTLNLRRSGSLSKLSQPKSVTSQIHATSSIENNPANDGKESDTRKFDSERTKPSGIPSAKPRRKIPTPKVPFR